MADKFITMTGSATDAAIHAYRKLLASVIASDEPPVPPSADATLLAPEQTAQRKAARAQMPDIMAALIAGCDIGNACDAIRSIVDSLANLQGMLFKTGGVAAGEETTVLAHAFANSLVESIYEGFDVLRVIPNANTPRTAS